MNNPPDLAPVRGGPDLSWAQLHHSWAKPTRERVWKVEWTITGCLTPPRVLFHQCLRCLHSLYQSNYSDVKTAASTNTSPSEKGSCFCPNCYTKWSLVWGFDPGLSLTFLVWIMLSGHKMHLNFCGLALWCHRRFSSFQQCLSLVTQQTHVYVYTHGWPSLFLDLPEELEELTWTG